MNVHAHHMSQSVGHEHGMCTSSYSLVGVSLHESELLEALRHDSAHGHMHVPPFDIGGSHLQSMVVTFLHDAVNLSLLLCECSANGRDWGIRA